MIQIVKKHYVKIISAIVILVVIIAVPYQANQYKKYDKIKANLGSHAVKESVVEEALASNNRKGKLVYIYNPADTKDSEDPQIIIDIAQKYNVDFMTIDAADSDALNFLKSRTDVSKLKLPIYVYFDQAKTYITFARLDKQELIGRIEDSGVGLRKEG